MKTARSQAELVTLRKHAQDIATGRKERMTSVHLLAAVASTEGPAGDLLRSCRLDAEGVLKASRSFDDEGPDPVGRLFAAAREHSVRGPTAEPTALHLLLALLADRSAAAHRSLVHAGVDLARLRTRAIPLAQGLVAARRPSAMRPKEEAPPLRPLAAPRPSRPTPSASSTQPSRSASTQPGVAVPLFPPPPGRRDTQRPAAPATAPVSMSLPAPAPLPSAVPAEQPRRSTPRSTPTLPPASGPRVPAEAAERFALDRELFPVLSTLGHNLTLAAAEGALEEVVGREAEIEQVLDILAKRHANSPFLVGPSGVGKTSVVRGLAQRFAGAADLTETRILVEIVVSELIAGTGTRGALAEKIAAIRAEVREARGMVVLFVDEAHELFGPGSLEEATAEIKLALARGELKIIGATTPEEYRKSIESDPALARRFSVVEVEEPCEEDAFLLLQSVASGLGRHHGLSYDDEALAAAVTWSIRYLPGRALPDKAISILDLAGARARRKLGPGGPKGSAKVGAPEVAEVVSELADLPVERLLETDRERMLSLESLLAERVVGHSAPIERIARVLRRNAAGLRGRRPIGSFLLLGPTGVGKTETAKAIAEALFHSPDAMTRLDFSEYAEAHAVARLVGAPPGYIGHEAGGQLTEAVRRRPYQVILLDEIEKAHRDVLEAFLQVFDEGRLTDGRGRRVDFTNTVIVMTSNLGAAEAGAAKAERSVGFSRRETTISSDRLGEVMLSAAKSFLPPELYNRIDEVLCFAPLSRADVAEIARRLLHGLADSLLARGVRLDVDPAAVNALLDAGGFDADLGARPMKRTIARLIENPLAELILRGDLEDGAVALVSVERGEIMVDAVDGERAATG
jgi:ATP-dependent Clp protease ATP-binding subunit ClpC